MKAVILESHAVQAGDLCWDALRPLTDELEIYPHTPQGQAVERLAGAQMAIMNKTRIDDAVLDQCPELRWIGLIATGTDNVDLAACRRHGVLVANAPGYSTHSVAQFAFSLLLAACQSVDRMDPAVRDGCWKQMGSRYGVRPLVELYGRTFGVVGYGDIGRAAVRIARGFGMKTLACTRTIRPEYAQDDIEFVDLPALLERCDVISLHCPLTAQTAQLINEDSLRGIRPGAILINTARGGLVEEGAVADACRDGRLAWYLADVAAKEPIEAGSPLLTVPNTILTPHVAWATGAALHNLQEIVIQNFRSFLAGSPEHIVNL